MDVSILVAHKGLRTADPDTGEFIDLANAVDGFDFILGNHTDVEFADTINGPRGGESSNPDLPDRLETRNLAR